MKRFIIKITVKENYFSLRLHRDELLQCGNKFKEIILNHMQYVNNFS